MNTKIEKNFNYIINYFIVIQPIIDLITSLCLNIININITFGIIIRTIFLLFIMYSAIFVYKEKKIMWYYLVILVYFFMFMFNIFCFDKGINFFGHFQLAIRTFYFPILLSTFYSLKDRITIRKEFMKKSLIIYILIITISNLCNIGFKSYEITKTGTLGYFNSANEVGGIMSILLPLLIMEKSNKNKIFTYILYICYIYVILNIGTKTPVLTFLLTIILLITWLIIKLIKQKKVKKLVIIFSAGILFTMLTIPIITKTAFYKNIKIHLNFLGVNNAQDVLSNPQLIDHFIFSQRLTFLKNRKITYEKSNFLQKSFGNGYFVKGKEIKLAEMDYFDIYYSHGFVGFIIYYFPIFLIIYSILKYKTKITFEKYKLYISLIIMLLLSFFTGHIMTSPSVSFFATCIIIAIYNENLKRDKI